MEKTAEVWGWIDTVQTRISDVGIKIAAETVRFSKQVGGQACAVVSSQAREQIAELKKYGIGKVYLLEADHSDHQSEREALQGLSQFLETRQPRFLLLPANSLGNEWAARLSIRFDADVRGEIVDYAKFKGKLQLREKVYGGKAHALLTVESERFSILTISLAALDRVEQPVRDLEVVSFLYKTGTQPILLKKVEPVHWSEIPIDQAEFIIGVGRGVTKGDMKIVEKLAEMWNCPIGGSKVADERGYISRERRIGASGKTISSHIYLAIGISGAPHHLAGIKYVKHLVVINPDISAPISKNAELVIGLPCQEVLPKIVERMEGQLEVVS